MDKLNIINSLYIRISNPTKNLKGMGLVVDGTLNENGSWNEASFTMSKEEIEKMIENLKELIS